MIRFRTQTLTAITAFGIMLAGCQKSSHVSVSTYEYSDGPPPTQTGGTTTYERPSSDYQMTSPGQMASPGEMTSPGRPVVEPRRSP